MEYQGRMDIDEQLLADLIRCTKMLQAKVAQLEPPAEDRNRTINLSKRSISPPQVHFRPGSNVDKVSPQ